MSDQPPIKRHEVFLIIALLLLLCSYAVNGWIGLGLALFAAGWSTAFLVTLFEDKTP